MLPFVTHALQIEWAKPNKNVSANAYSSPCIFQSRSSQNHNRRFKLIHLPKLTLPKLMLATITLSNDATKIHAPAHGI
jgi:hypothetical protein